VIAGMGQGQGGRTARRPWALRSLLAGVAALVVMGVSPPPAAAQRDTERLVGGRFTVLHEASDAVLARALLRAAQANDSFPGLPRPQQRVVIAVAPTPALFREWVGDAFPEWGAAAAFPASQRIVMQGAGSGGSRAGDPLVVLRHELAHLALAEALGDLPPRWFDEGYASLAAGEWGREEVLATNIALVWRGPRTFAELDAMFSGGDQAATGAYALAHRAVAELAALDPARGLSLFFRYWQDGGSLDLALRQAYGLTTEGYEAHWVRRTQRRYGALALAGDFAAALGLLFVGLLPVFLRRRRRERRRLEALRAAEAEQERRARDSALEALLASVPPPKGQGLLDTPSDAP
jgi:hypothetical protein